MRRPTSEVRPDPVAELATLLARGYLRLLARKAPSGAGNSAREGPDSGLDFSDETSVHGGRLTGGDCP